MRFLLIYGALGLLLEVTFTGIRSIIRRDWAAPATTYLWMPLVYGPAGLTLHMLSSAFDLPLLVKALIYTLVIYCFEFVGGLVLAGLTDILQAVLGGTNGGDVPWHYDDTMAPMGIVNFRYFPLWFALAMCFERIDSWIS